MTATKTKQPIKVVDDKELSDLLTDEHQNPICYYDTYSSFFEEYFQVNPTNLAEVTGRVLIGRIGKKDLYLKTKIRRLGDYGQIFGDNPLNGVYISKMPNIPDGKNPSCDGCWVPVRLDLNNY